VTFESGERVQLTRKSFAKRGRASTQKLITSEVTFLSMKNEFRAWVEVETPMGMHRMSFGIEQLSKITK